ncbi:MAG: VOC family protein [Bacteriovoracaceae bacterium]|nr:lactoylglutathione lyase [Halobacteriovoraceae bacterium]MDP7320626.1 VOC family protein [Bacteriovoracaceae bacterium]
MRFLHSMLRVKDLDQALYFFVKLLGLKEMRRKEVESGRFTLVFLKSEDSDAEIELTHNWDHEVEYTQGRNFGHLAFEVENIYEICTKLQKAGVVINRPPRDGHMAFIKSPDNISIELLQKGEALPIQEPWSSMENSGEW